MLTTVFLANRGACDAGRAFAIQYKTMDEVWAHCHNPAWLIWILAQTNASDADLRRIACWCARHTPLASGGTIWDLLTDPRSRTAVEVAEAFSAGLVSIEKVEAVREAAWAAARTVDAGSRTLSAQRAREAAWAAAWTVAAEPPYRAAAEAREAACLASGAPSSAPAQCAAIRSLVTPIWS